MSLNRVTLIGRVGKDPEIREMNNGSRAASFTFATTERGYTTREGRQVPDRTEWHNIVVYGPLVKVIEGYVSKGSPLYIEGALRYRSYDDREGVKRYVTEVHAESIELFGRSERASHTEPTPAEDSYKDWMR